MSPPQTPTEQTRLLTSAIDDDHDHDHDDTQHLLASRRLHSTLAWHSRPTVGILCLAVFTFFIQESVCISSFVVCFISAVCKHLQQTDPTLTCSETKVQEVISATQGVMMLVCGALSCLVSGKMGEHSDRVGRRKVFIFAGSFMLLNRLAYLWVFQPSTPYHKSWMIVTAAIQGLSGGNVVMLSLASSYVTDIVDSEHRTRSLGFVMGSFYAGMASGPLLGSFIVRETGDPLMALCAAAVFAALFLLLVTFGLVESRPEILRTRSQSMHLQRKASFHSQRSGRSVAIVETTIWSLINAFKPLKMLWLPKHKTQGFVPRFNVVALILAECFLFFVAVSNGAPLVLYATNKYNLNSEKLGYYVSLVGISKTTALYTICPLLLLVLRTTFKQHKHAPDWIDYCLILFGCFNDLIAPLMILKSTSMSYIYGSAVFGAMGAVVTPTIQSTIMKYYSESKSGEVFGAIAVMKNVSVMIGPPTGLFIYSHTVATHPKFFFVICAIFVAIGIVCAVCLKVHDDLEVRDFIKRPRSSGSFSTDYPSDSESEATVPPSPMRIYDAVRRGSAGGPTPRDPGF